MREITSTCRSRFKSYGDCDVTGMNCYPHRYPVSDLSLQLERLRYHWKFNRISLKIWVPSTSPSLLSTQSSKIGFSSGDPTVINQTLSLFEIAFGAYIIRRPNFSTNVRYVYPFEFLAAQLLPCHHRSPEVFIFFDTPLRRSQRIMGVITDEPQGRV